jgi:hypothetical protein
MIIADVTSIWLPLLYRQHGAALFGLFFSTMALSLVLIVVATLPWHFERSDASNLDSQDYWLNYHPGRLFSMAGVFALVLGFVMVYAAANGIGGATGFSQVGRRYFETYPGSPMVPITKAHFIASVRAEGISTSFFVLAGSVVCVAIGITLRRVSDQRLA